MVPTPNLNTDEFYGPNIMERRTQFTLCTARCCQACSVSPPVRATWVSLQNSLGKNTDRFAGLRTKLHTRRY